MSVKDIIDKVLIADFFLVVFALAWLGVGLAVAQSGGTDLGTTPVLDVWFGLWPTLWQGALGLLMAGALTSGGLAWIAENKSK